jgi:Calcium-binding EGF domain/EGF domain
MQRVLLTAGLAFLTLACSEPKCLPNERKVGMQCRALKDAATVDEDESGQSGIRTSDAAIDGHLLRDDGGVTARDGAHADANMLDASVFVPEAGADDSGADPSSDVRPPDGSGPDASIPPPSCREGFALDRLGTCQDIDECAQAIDDCSDEPNACVNRPGSFECTCPAGYRGNGKGAAGCMDVDECASKTAQCDALATCTNTPGGYACGECQGGYREGTDGTCVDLDECASNNGGCASIAKCNNALGAPNTCSCPGGYSGNGVGPNGCVDVDECAANNGNCASVAICTNALGTPSTCTCPSGYSGNGIGPNGCAPVVVYCSAGACSPGGRCVEGNNDYSCGCDSGYEPTNGGKACALSDGQACSSDEACHSHSCYAGKCRDKVDLNGTCDSTADCAPGHSCNGVECKRDNGGACASDFECITEACPPDRICRARGILNRTCDTDSDCLTGLQLRCDQPTKLCKYTANSSEDDCDRDSDCLTGLICGWAHGLPNGACQ